MKNKIKLLGFERRTELHWVKIHFANPSFVRITKDEKANFETKLSAIGGTMGLLTGVSIISAVELLFFVAKMLMSLISYLMGLVRELICLTSKQTDKRNKVDLERKRMQNNMKIVSLV